MISGIDFHQLTPVLSDLFVCVLDYGVLQLFLQTHKQIHK